MIENEYTKREREKTGEVQVIYKTFICLETIINKFDERLLHNLMNNLNKLHNLNKKDAGMSDN